jgi:glycosyltransferase involved in cell wall biosynthesis
MARAVCVPSVTTLHTPPTPWLESAIRLGPCPVSFVAVSASTAKAWQHVVPRAQVVLNGIDLSRWVPGAGGGPLVWFGRLVPEKGAHLAAEAARAAGLPLQLAGPRADPAYFDMHVAPLLGNGIGYLGHLSHAELVEVVSGATATVVTPRWDEPYGLAAAESLACATPVVAFDRGGLREVVDDRCALLVPPDDIDALAGALVRAKTLDRGSARRRAEQHCSAERMVDEYERLYRRLSPMRAA